MQATCLALATDKKVGRHKSAGLSRCSIRSGTRRCYFFFAPVFVAPVRAFVERLAGAFFAVVFPAVDLRAVVDLAAVFFLGDRFAVALADVAFVEVFFAGVALAAEVFFLVERLAAVFFAGAFFAGLLAAAVFFLGDRFAAVRVLAFAGVFLVAAISLWLLIIVRAFLLATTPLERPVRGGHLVSEHSLVRPANQTKGSPPLSVHETGHNVFEVLREHVNRWLEQGKQNHGPLDVRLGYLLACPNFAH
jgi:hypothetical protein